MGQECQCVNELLDQQGEESNEVVLSPIHQESVCSFDKSFLITDELLPSRRKRKSQLKKFNNVKFVMEESFQKKSPNKDHILLTAPSASPISSSQAKLPKITSSILKTPKIREFTSPPRCISVNSMRSNASSQNNSRNLTSLISGNRGRRDRINSTRTTYRGQQLSLANRSTRSRNVRNKTPSNPQFFVQGVTPFHQTHRTTTSRNKPIAVFQPNLRDQWQQKTY